MITDKNALLLTFALLLSLSAWANANINSNSLKNVSAAKESAFTTGVGTRDDLSFSLSFNNSDPIIKFSLMNATEILFGDNTKTPKTIAVNSGAVTTSLLSTSFGGVATLRAVLIYKGQKVDSTDLQIPIDTDGDQIADVWERDPINGGALSLGKNNIKDRNWDEDKSSGNSNDGDGYTKWDEYLGTVVNGAHMRLKPTRKEIFFDTSLGTEGAFVKQEFQKQLDVDVYEVGPGFSIIGTVATNKVVLKDMTSIICLNVVFKCVFFLGKQVKWINNISCITIAVHIGSIKTA